MTACADCPMRGFGGLWPIMPPLFKAGCNRCAQGLHWSDPGACRHQFTARRPNCYECRTVAACGVFPASLAILSPDVSLEMIDRVRCYVITAREESRHRARPLTRDNFVTFITDLYRDLDRPIVVWPGREASMDLSLLEGPSIPYWVRDYLFEPRDPNVRGRIKMLTRPRIALIASVLKAADPEWGRSHPLAAVVQIGKTVTAWMDREPSHEFSEGAGAAQIGQDWDDLIL